MVKGRGREREREEREKVKRIRLLTHFNNDDDNVDDNIRFDWTVDYARIAVEIYKR